MTDQELTDILETYKWIPVGAFKDDTTASWEDRFRKLEAHHYEETTFLIDQVRAFARRVHELEG